MPTTPVFPESSIRASRGLPGFHPVPLALHAAPFDDPEWLFEPKYDGIRGAVCAWATGCEIRSWRDVPLKRFAGLWDRLAEVLRGREVVLDGEIVSLDRQGKPVFKDLIRGQGFLAFAAYDLLWLDGVDMRSQPLSERKRLLGDLLPEDTGPLYKILTIKEHGRALYSAIVKLDLEGIVAKRAADAYGPATLWYKIRNPAHPQIEHQEEATYRRSAAQH